MKSRTNKLFILLFISSICACSKETGDTQNDYKLWYRQPAHLWVEALPLGNGRLGAMVYGGTGTEHLQLNEATVWAGEPGNNIQTDIKDHLTEIRQLIYDGKNTEAQELANQYLPRHATENNNYGMPYQPVGDLFIEIPGHDSVESYYRDLNIGNAIASVSYTVKDVNFKREVFSSFVDDVIILQVSANQPGKISCNLGINSPQVRYKVSTDNGILVMRGVSGDARPRADGASLARASLRLASHGGARDHPWRSLRDRLPR